MEDDASTSLDGKGVGNLRVVDLKLELEKRGLSKSGSKKDLVKRLKQQLEFEKLCEERKSGDFDRKLELDAATEQNEFVQQYLAQQQKRLELQALQKHSEGDETNISESQVTTEKSLDSDSDETAEESSESEELSKSNKQTKHKDGADVQDTTACNPDDKHSNVAELGSEEPDCFLSPIILENIDTKEISLDLNCKKQVETNQISSLSLVDVKNENFKNESSSYNIDSRTLIDAENSSESAEIKSDKLPVLRTLDSVKEQTGSFENIYDSGGKKSEVLFQNISDASDSKKNSLKSVHSKNITEHSENVVTHSTFLNTSEEDAKKASEDHSTLEGSSSLEKLSSQDSSSMESSVPYSLSDIQLPESPGHHLKSKDLISEENCNKVENNSDVTVDENSISEAKIQSNGVSTAANLNSNEEVVSESESKSTTSTVSPEKPNQRKESEDKQTDESSDVESEKSDRNKKSLKSEEVFSKTVDIEKNTSKEIKGKEQKSSKRHQSDESDKTSDSEKYKHSQSDSKHKSHVKHKKAPESPPSKTSVDIEENVPKENISKEKSKHHQSDESDKSSDSDKYKHSRLDSKHKSHIKHRKKLESQSLKTSLDKEEITPKEIESKEKRASKLQNDPDDESDRSSDSEKFKHSRLNLKHKSHVKHRKRNRQSRSQSSTSSSSRSSDSSPKRRHSKKSVVTVKSKNFENNENIKVADKSISEKKDEQKQEDCLTESPSAPSVSSKKRLKIKRDNVAIEVNVKNIESIESTSTKNNNSSASNFHSVPEKPLIKESTEVKLSLTELPYVPRKVSLSNRKLNRKSSEDKSNEPNSKKSKWESFAAGQKVSQTISISTDSLKNWFPDFKLINEPPSSMEVEPDEHSLSTDEKNSSLAHIDASYGNDFGAKHESTSHMDVEDSESQEANLEDSSEQGPVSKIIFIQNLVRPFTLNQLKELLKQYGKIVEEYFWIDKIKSKCFVMYEAEKEAVKARNALHNTRWPSSNPKILTVDFSNEEEMEQHKKGNELPPKPVIEPPVAESLEEIEPRASHSVEEHKRRDRERRKERERSKPQPPVREWDKDKVLQDSPERDRSAKEEKPRSSDKKEKKESKKRPNEDTPAKLLDDLFQKTKNPPCIYWLPLTEEQAQQKEEAQKLRKLEREKRNQQLKEQEEAERRSKRARSSRRSREKENRKSSTRSRSPVTRRR